jgi:effector-binding domain-containing protein
MKKTIIICILISIPILYAFRSSYSTKYSILKTVGSVEIREYPKSLFASYYSKNSGDNSKFKVLANYIFGGNDRDEQIGMTSPVSIKISSKNKEMLFLMPFRYNDTNIPKPNNNEIKIISIEKRKVATLSFSGYANDEKVENKKQELIETLKNHSIEHSNEFELLVYDSPYKLLNRRNEVLVVLHSK